MRANQSQEKDRTKILNQVTQINLSYQFENSISPEQLENNKSLVLFMDDNLSIHIDDYMANPIIQTQCPLTKEELIETITSSRKYTYDNQTNMIRLRERPQRRLIVFRDVPQEYQNEYSIKDILKEAPSEPVEKVEIIGHGLVAVYFLNEAIAMDTFKWLEKKREESSFPFYISAFMKEENKKKEILKLNKDEDMEVISNIILDSKHHQPRKLSSNEEKTLRQNLKKEDVKKKMLTKSKFDEYDPLKIISEFISAKTINENAKRRRGYSMTLKNDYYLPESNDMSEEKVNHKYSMKMISTVFMRMKMFTRFTFPQEWKDDFIKDIMSYNQLHNLVTIFGQRNVYYPYHRRRSNTNYMLDYKKSNKKNISMNLGNQYNEDFGSLRRRDDYSFEEYN